MRIIIMSDSHGNSEIVFKIVEQNIYTADMFIHLGDGENDAWRAIQHYPDIRFVQVRGNCDKTDKFPLSQIIDTVEGPNGKIVKLFVTHGHLFGAKSGTDKLWQAGIDNNCDIVLFGHSHRRYDETRNGRIVLNPGSCMYPRNGERSSYAYVDISMWGIITSIVDI